MSRHTLLLWLCLWAAPWAQATPLNLEGYADASGAISVQHQGGTVDPYFALQALLLAHSHGLDISAPAEAWARWLVARQKPDATFDRFCRQGPVWAACKTADADDSVLGLWMAFIDTLPAAQRGAPAIVKSRAAAQAALARLVDPTRGIYLVSPVYQHGLLMDNLELWEHRFTHPPTAHATPASPSPSVRRSGTPRGRATWSPPNPGSATPCTRSTPTRWRRSSPCW